MILCTCRFGTRCTAARRISRLLRRALREEPIRGPIKPMRVACLQAEAAAHCAGYRERRQIPAGETREAKTLRKQEQARRWAARKAEAVR